jgi:7,8-dihydropterin-6-yl-methyl-4-(beta-D-ribofuranosyl)aminobenzene 5'-phosphate synthase
LNSIIKPYKIEEIDNIEIISLVDNHIDFNSYNQREEIQTYRQWSKTQTFLPIAEHGFSLLIRLIKDRKTNSILFDTGSSPNGIIVNSKRMGIELSEVDIIVLSHGHYDHFGGLLSSIKAIKRKNLPIIVHEDMFKTRATKKSNGTIRVYPKFPAKEQLRSVKLISTKKPQLIADNKALVTGEIPRKTNFEKGYLKHKMLKNGSWKADPWIWDDQALILNLKRKGLVIISGCAHAGIINTTNYAKQISNKTNIYAVLGGLHLIGKNAKKRIKKTIEEIKKINPEILVSAHCTGWQANCALANIMKQKFVWNSVGNLYKF